MTDSRTLFVTGATGFVGSALLLELLRTRAGDRAFCLVRGSSRPAAQQRLRDALVAAADAYGVPEAELVSVLERAEALRGDVTSPFLGLDPADVERVAAGGPVHVWHCAASLKDSEEAMREIVAHNVGGAERVLETTLDIGVAIFNHVSTAYVAGRTVGVADEYLARPRGFCNRYEQSKHYAEAMVRDNCDYEGVPYRVLRPGIVVGHSQTGRATGYTGFLGWAIKLAVFNQQCGGVLEHQSLRYVARPDTEINLVPIDSVVEDCIGIDAGGLDTCGRVFHLTNASAPTVGWVCNTTAELLGLRPFEFVDSPDDLDSVSKRFHKWTRFERPYVLARKQFMREESNELYTSPRHGRCPIDRRLFEKMVRAAMADYQRSVAAGKGAA